jgi:F0F1-type ATP synthase epsilon subunit
MSDANNTFQCVVVAPPGKVIDCRATSVVFPAHDGMVGILRDHMPMFCELGLGMMEVEYLTEKADKPQSKAFLVIDRGFALICENLLTLITNDAVSSIEAKKEKIEHKIEKLAKKLSTAAAYTPDQQEHETKKLTLLKQLLETAGKSSN